MRSQITDQVDKLREAGMSRIREGSDPHKKIVDVGAAGMMAAIAWILATGFGLAGWEVWTGVAGLSIGAAITTHGYLGWRKQLYLERVGRCPDQWLHAVANQDHDDLWRRLTTWPGAGKVSQHKDGTWSLWLWWKITNSSIHAVSMDSIAGNPAIVGDDGNELLLPSPVIFEDRSRRIPHGEAGTLQIRIILDQYTRSQIKQISAMQQETGKVVFSSHAYLVVSDGGAESAEIALHDVPFSSLQIPDNLE